MSKLHSINKDQRLYVLECGKGFTCFGFDNCRNEMVAIANELKAPFELYPLGTQKAYAEYLRILDLAKAEHEASGWRSRTGLTAQLLGLEGKRVEVVDKYDEKRRFIVGKSTGFVPCHLEIKTRRSHGGCSVMGTPFKSLRVV